MDPFRYFVFFWSFSFKFALNLCIMCYMVINICYSPAGRSVLGETVPEVLASGGTQTEGTVSTYTDLPRPMNNIFYFFATEI